MDAGLFAGSEERSVPHSGVSHKTRSYRHVRPFDGSAAASPMPFCSELSWPNGNPDRHPSRPHTPRESTMLYTVANDDWTPGSPLSASETRSGLYRTRSEAAAIARGRRLLAVSVRYDDHRCVLTPSLPPDGKLNPSWLTPAIVGPNGGVTALAEIPANLVRALGPCRLWIHAGHSDDACSRATGRGNRLRSLLRR